ncbi:MAG: deoxyribodipyrimidine photo-lyase [Actinomycetota bacterium]|nr:deoxyribodipyrimidine photo-lyase [Actinomycetota bacterium]
MPGVVLWFRRDLRLADNRALERALLLADGGPVHAFFCASPALLATSPMRSGYLGAALGGLDRSLLGRLGLAHGDPASEVAAFANRAGAEVVVATREFTPLARRRDERAAALLGGAGIKLELGDSPYLLPPGKLARAAGGWHRVFTPFYRRLSEHGFDAPRPAPEADALEAALAEPVLRDARALGVLGLPELFDRHRFGATEEEALAQLAAFAERAGEYPSGRNLPAAESTSRLSPALRFGLLHPRQVAAALSGLPGGDEAIRQLVWRDFFAQTLASEPRSAWENLDPRFDRMAHDDPSASPVRERLETWKQGRTGFPLVDAGMRELANTGWMHNRARMVVASFLVKDLHIDWRVGARHFMENLLDGDLASNNHSWQWVAGSGTDAAPYFRVFNPVLQAKKFDPEGSYIRAHLPELAHLPTRFVHEPWEAKRLGMLEPDAYPEPIVDHAREREEALRRFGEISGKSEAGEAGQPA